MKLTRKKGIAALVIGATAVAVLAGCTSQADTVSRNISTDADSFKINRQVVFHDDITNTYIASVEGRCSLGNDDTSTQTTVTCQIGPSSYVKEIFRTGKNTSVSAVQTEPSSSDPYHYTVVLKPQEVIPHIQVQTGK